MKKIIILAVCLTATVGLMAFANNISNKHKKKENKTMKTVYEFTVKDRKGGNVSLKEYANEVLLIVNTATKCGFTPQYEELEQLYKRHHKEGFEILDFPCNQFGQQARHRRVYTRVLQAELRHRVPTIQES